MSSDDCNSNSSCPKLICSICFEDVKPLAEDLQSISVCGHVFHELCLQQWFEYCPNLKKRTCPICKQACTNANVTRLYFQSVGDTNESVLSQKQTDHGGESSAELRIEVIRLEGKVGALTLNLNKHQKELEEVREQLSTCKEQLKVEVRLKNEIQAQKNATQKLLQVKSEEQDQMTLAYMKEQEKTMALAKELAAIKLVSDLNLDEEEVMRLASFGNDTGSKETVDVLRRSLVIRNKNYKELMTKCNILGRGEAKSLQRLDKASEKIKTLKLRVQELETALEIRDNEALGALKDHQDCKLNTRPHEKLMKEAADKNSAIDETTTRSSYDQNEQKRDECENIACPNISGQGFSSDSSVACNRSNVIIVRRRKECKQDAPFDTRIKAEMLKSGDEKPCDMDDEVICYGNTNPAETSFHIRKETRASSPFRPGEHCFSGGLLGPDHRTNLGKWCNKVQNIREGSKASSSTFLQKRSNEISGDLIAVGADGRGCRVKVMRSLHHQSTLNTKDGLSWENKMKPCLKTNGKQNHGHLQIEHFFRRAD